MLDYTLLPREVVDSSFWKRQWDVAVLAYNSSPRVLELAKKIFATHVIWVVHREYQYDSSEIKFPVHGNSIVADDTDDEASLMQKLLDQIDGIASADGGKSIVVDITGFMRAHLVVLVQLFAARGIRAVDFLYSDPVRYKRKSATSFGVARASSTRQVRGCEGEHEAASGNDLLIIGAGYDHDMMKEVAEQKRHAQTALVLGFPSLAADMYQESVLRITEAEEELRQGLAGDRSKIYYAPASDPFVTASVLRSIVDRERTYRKTRSFYLSPLGTKPQVLGFAVFFAYERQWLDNAISVLLPEIRSYERDTSQGIGRVWHYAVPFQVIEKFPRR